MMREPRVRGDPPGNMFKEAPLPDLLVLLDELPVEVDEAELPLGVAMACEGL